MNLKVLQLQKRSAYHFKYIQDKCAFNIEKKTFALTDGTTQSYNSEIWAKILAENFTENPDFDLSRLIPRFRDEVKKYKDTKFVFSENLAIASIEKSKLQKGATSTFIGIQIKEDRKVQFIGCGDSNIFVVKNNTFRSYPFPDLEAISSNASFLNTTELIANKIDSNYFYQDRIKLEEDEIIIMASDALSRFIFKQPAIISELLAINTFEQMHAFCLRYWESKQLEEDDISAMIINLDQEKQVAIINPDEDFEFPREKEFEFSPVILESNTNQYSASHMQEITNQFNGVARDMHEVKMKIKTNKLLLFACLVLLSLNLIGLLITHIYVKSKQANDISNNLSTRLRIMELQLKASESKPKESINKEVVPSIEQNKEVSSVVDSVEKTGE